MAKGRSVPPKKGDYIHYKGELYIVLDSDAAGVDVVPADTPGNRIADQPQRISITEIFPRDSKPDSVVVYAATKEEIFEILARRQSVTEAVHPQGLPKSLLDEAQLWIASVRLIDELTAEARARLDKVQRITIATFNDTISASVHLTHELFHIAKEKFLEEIFEIYSREQKITLTMIQQLACACIGITLSTYYYRKKRCAQYQWNRDKIAKSLQRSDVEDYRIDLATRHFVDRCIMRIERSAKGIYETMQSLLSRNRGYWIDVKKCGVVPEELIDDLFDQQVTIDEIFKNREKASLLKLISLPSLPWFYNYFAKFKKHPNNAREYIIKVHGADVWEREYLVFDTFVRRVSKPLEAVFADHLRVDVNVVDEADRQSTYTLWFSVALDAFTRCPLGIALLHEPPCIDSIQTLLHHAIWPKVDFEDIKLSTLWPCYGIPEHFSIDNAWAHHSHTVEILADKIGQGGNYATITLHFRRPYTARQGALIERFFRNIADRIREALRGAGAIPLSDPKRRRGARQEAQAGDTTVRGGRRFVPCREEGLDICKCDQIDRI